MIYLLVCKSNNSPIILLISQPHNYIKFPFLFPYLHFELTIPTVHKSSRNGYLLFVIDGNIRDLLVCTELLKAMMYFIKRVTETVNAGFSIF